jgi:hypothetical protein
VVGVGAGMVAERGGEVDRPSPAQHPDDQVAQAGHDVRPTPVRTWEASSAKATSRTWCRPFSIAQCPRRGQRAERGWPGVGKAGDRVDDHGPPSPTAQVAGLTGGLNDLRGVGKPEPADGDRLEGAQLDAAMPAVAGAVQDGNVVPGQAGATVQQGGLPWP